MSLGAARVPPTIGGLLTGGSVDAGGLLQVYVLGEVPISAASQVALMLKNPPANTVDMGSIPGLGRPPGGGRGDPLQCSCLENLMDRGAWRATVHGVTKSWT